MNYFKQNRLAAAIVSVGLCTSAPILLAQEYTPEISAARLESRIDTTYDLNRYLRDYQIHVSVVDDKATLSGIVGEDITKDLAGKIALSVAGIKSIDNRIEIQEEHVKAASDNENLTFGEAVDDMSITAAVKSKLLWSRYTNGLKTDVDTSGGVVTLSGTADSDQARGLAYVLAQNTHGVISVTNLLTLVPAGTAPIAGSDKGSASQAISDTWITAKVKSTFIMSNNVRSSDISVATRDGIVFLRGTVPSGTERELAITLTGNVRGVKSVNSDSINF